MFKNFVPETTIKITATPESLAKLPNVISKYTNFKYEYNQTETGCFLKPMVFEMLPYRNCFVPELDVSIVSYDDTQMILNIKGQPVTDPEFFMGLCFASTALMVIVVIPSIFSKWENLLLIFIPIFLCVVMYFFCKIVPKSTFESIIDAIKKDLS